MRWNAFAARCLLTLASVATVVAADALPAPVAAQSRAHSKAHTSARPAAKSSRRRASRATARPVARKPAPSIDQADAVYADAATTALHYLKAHRSRSTGLVNA